MVVHALLNNQVFEQSWLIMYLNSLWNAYPLCIEFFKNAIANFSQLEYGINLLK